MILLPHRAVLRLSGPDRLSFLQGMITNDVQKLTPEHPLYAVLLSPQGKILFDFILVASGEEILIDCWREKTTALIQRLTMYKLRAKVTIAEDASLRVYASPNAQCPMPNALPDPRNAALGQRLITAETLQATGSLADYETHRIALGIPDSADFIEDRSFPMEFGLMHLHAISYTKGCYIGQEIIARARTRGALNKALHRVQSSGAALPSPGTSILADGAEIGQMRSHAGAAGLAMLRLGNSHENLTADGIALTASIPDWFSLPTPAMP